MKDIKVGNIVIEKEMTENRFYDLVRGYRIDESGRPIAFLGKFFVPSNFTDGEIIKLYTRKAV